MNGYIFEIEKRTYDKPWMFRGRDHNISYRLLICYGVRRLLHNNWSSDQCDAELKKLINTWDRLSNTDMPIEGCTDNELFHLYVIHSYNYKDYLLIDKSKGCYPLVLFDGVNRNTAFYKSLETIVNKKYFDNIIECLKQHVGHEWTEGLQNELHEIIPRVYNHK